MNVKVKSFVADPYLMISGEVQNKKFRLYSYRNNRFKLMFTESVTNMDIDVFTFISFQVSHDLSGL